MSVGRVGPRGVFEQYDSFVNSSKVQHEIAHGLKRSVRVSPAMYLALHERYKDVQKNYPLAAKPEDGGGMYMLGLRVFADDEYPELNLDSEVRR